MTAWSRKKAGRSIVLLTALAMVIAACGGDEEEPAATPDPAEEPEAPAEEPEEPEETCEWPTENVQFWAHRAPGGGHDATVRGLAPIFEQYTDYNFVVDNEGGAGGVVGAGDLTREAGNPHMLALIEPGGLLLNQLVDDGAGYDVLEFTVLGQAVQRGMSIVVSPTIGVETWEELLEWVDEGNDPLYAGTGPGSIYYNLMNIVYEEAGLDWIVVPHGGAGETIPALVRGDAIVLGQNTETNSLATVDGDVVSLVQFDDPKYPLIPDVPQGKDIGFPAEWDGVFGDLLWIVAPPDIDDCTAGLMQEKFEEVMNSPEADAWVEQTGRSLVYGTPEETFRILETQAAIFDQYMDLVEANILGAR